MRIGILSDTHDKVARTALALRRLSDAGAEHFIHCGDLTGPAVVEQFAGYPTHFVFGNNDYDESALLRAMALVDGVCLGLGGLIELGGRRLAVTHGHLLGETRRLLDQTPDYFFFGHSHAVEDRRYRATRLINPGALHRADAWTVALLDLDTEALTMLTLGHGT